MNQNILASAEAYLRAWDSKDLAEISKYLHPDVRFIGPMAEVTGKEPVLVSSKRMFPLMQNLKVRATFRSGDQVMAAYDFICGEPIGTCRTAELMTFQDGLIARIELFFDARPFEKLMQAKSLAKQSA
jgi:ketosteroid isomerase-like protein